MYKVPPVQAPKTLNPKPETLNPTLETQVMPTVCRDDLEILNPRHRPLCRDDLEIRWLRMVEEAEATGQPIDSVSKECYSLLQDKGGGQDALRAARRVE